MQNCVPRWGYPHVCHVSDPFTPNVKADVLIGFRLKCIIKVEQIKLGSRASKATSPTPTFNGSALHPGVTLFLSTHDFFVELLLR